MKFYKNFVIIWTIVYFSIAILGRFFSDKKEYFPFFRWSLYSKTPNTLKTPYIMINKIGDSVIEPPVNLRDLEKYHQSSYTTVNYIVTKFFNSDNNFNKEQLVKDNALLNLIPENATYTLHIREIDLSKKDIDKVGKSKRIGTFYYNKRKSN